MIPDYECTIKEDEVKLVEKVGEGRFGPVYSAQCRAERLL